MSIHIKLDGTHVVTEDSSGIIQERLAAKLTAFNEMNDHDARVLKAYRSSELFDSDWTQGVDSPLDSTTKTVWATYRQGLRDLPASANWPNRFTKAEFPLAPGVTDIPDDAIRFVSEIDDPLGIGTTSWVSQVSETVELAGPPVYKNTPNTRKTIIFEAPLSTMQGTVSIGDTFAYNGESSTITGVAASSITLSTGIGATISIGTTGNFLQEKILYIEQEFPHPVKSVSVGSTTASPGTAVTWTYKLENIVPQTLPVTWELHGADGLGLAETGIVNVGVSSTTSFAAITSVTVNIPSDLSAWRTDNREIYITFETPSDSGIGKIVGITT
tara:strand:- start:372 stop:1358 length:987 start_codon:yes stop_codon:yes gene_type:complete